MPVIFSTYRVMLMLAAAFIPERIFSPYEATSLAPSGSSENHNNPEHYFFNSFASLSKTYFITATCLYQADREGIVHSNLEATVATVFS